jgi:hypothetical protein
MSDQLPAVPVHPADPSRALRILALIAVGLGVAALAGAAFVLSYPGIHAFALQAGIGARLARGYPLIFDVLLVVIGAAVLSLRSAGLPSRLLAWICLLALLTAAAGADALHAAGRKLPAQTSAVTAAIVPWALVLIAFALLLAMLRQARLRRLATAGDPAVGPHGADRPGRQPDTLRLAAPQLTVPRQLTPDSVADSTWPAEPGDPAPAREADSEPAAEADVAPDDAGDDENSDDPADLAEPDQPQADHNGTDSAVSMLSPAPTPEDAGVDPEMPVFHRLWSSPVPPADEDG